MSAVLIENNPLGFGLTIRKGDKKPVTIAQEGDNFRVDHDRYTFLCSTVEQAILKGLKLIDAY